MYLLADLVLADDAPVIGAEQTGAVDFGDLELGKGAHPEKDATPFWSLAAVTGRLEELFVMLMLKSDRTPANKWKSSDVLKVAVRVDHFPDSRPGRQAVLEACC